MGYHEKYILPPKMSITASMWLSFGKSDAAEEITEGLKGWLKKGEIGGHSI